MGKQVGACVGSQIPAASEPVAVLVYKATPEKGARITLQEKPLIIFSGCKASSSFGCILWEECKRVLHQSW